MTPSKRILTRKEIRELLRLKEWSQADLARELGLFESTVSRWVRGYCSPVGRSRLLMREWLEDARKSKLNKIT